MSMEAYVDLYREEAFQVVFKRMFAERFLYRAMMLSRAEWKSKKKHVKKVELFERAFETKVFEKIN